MIDSRLFRSVFIGFIVFICLNNIISQTQVISPKTYNYFQGVQEFPDSIVRVFMINKESKSWQWDFAQNAIIGNNLKATEVGQIKDSTGALTPIPAEKIYVLSLPEGKTVLGIDQFHCDIDIASVLAFVSDSGYITMEVTIDENESWDKIQKIGLVRPDIIGVLLGGKTYYFDQQGNRIQFPEIEEIYSNVTTAGSAYIGTIDNRIFKLDSNFESFAVDFISDSILQVYKSIENKLLVITSKEVLIYDDQLELLQSTQEIDNVQAATTIKGRYWIGAENGLYELDSLLHILNFFPGSIHEQIGWLGNWSDSLLVIAQYDGINHTEMSLKKFGPQDIISLSGPDIAITQIIVPPNQRKVIDPYCPTFPGIHFDSLLITVVNHSEEVITNFKIGCDFRGPGQCLAFQKIWFVDTVSINPHESIDIFIDGFTMSCVFPRDFCAWTFSPNGIPDANPINDKFCDTIMLLNTNPPVENRLINTTYFDTYVSHQILPDGTIRFFFHSSYRYPEATYIDLKQGQSLTQIQPQTIYVPGSEYWNWSSDGFISLPFADGSILLINTTLECDVTVPGSIVKINENGVIDWYHDINVDFFYRAEEMMFLDSNRIGIQQEGGFMLIIDRQGNIISFEDANFPYSKTIQTLSGYVVSKDNRIFILDPGFHIINTHTLAGNVKQIWPQEGNEFIISAGEKFYLLDSLNQLEILALGNAHYDVVWKSKQYYWAADSLMRHVDIFLPSFSAFIYRGILPPGVDPIFGVTSGNNVFVLTEYLNSVSKGLLIYTGGSDNLHFRLQDDIGISAIKIPDTVYVYKSPWPIIGWTYRYDSIRVEVTNFGFDTVYHYEIQALDDLDCGFCFEIEKIWEIDIPLAPGATVSIPLGAFNPRCVPSISPLCMTTVGPNAKADKNVANDKLCQAILNTIVSNADITASRGIQIFPNPADDAIHIEIDNENYVDLNGYVYSSTGLLMNKIKIDSKSTMIPISDYSPGIYFLRLFDDKGQSGTKRFVVIH